MPRYLSPQEADGVTYLHAGGNTAKGRGKGKAPVAPVAPEGSVAADLGF